MDRFWDKVAKAGADECWPWLSYKSGSGYGGFKMGGKQHSAHRLSWKLVNGPIPDGLSVLHRCDNPICVNPTHLFLGTPQANMTDMANKGRSRSGMKPWSHCKRGHEFTDDNIIRQRNGTKTCRLCFNQYHRDYQRRRRK